MSNSSKRSPDVLIGLLGDLTVFFVEEHGLIPVGGVTGNKDEEFDGKDDEVVDVRKP